MIGTKSASMSEERVIQHWDCCGLYSRLSLINILRNVPSDGIWNWDPGAHFGIYRPDTFWFADETRRNRTAVATTEPPIGRMFCPFSLVLVDDPVSCTY